MGGSHIYRHGNCSVSASDRKFGADVEETTARSEPVPLALNPCQPSRVSNPVAEMFVNVSVADVIRKCALVCPTF